MKISKYLCVILCLSFLSSAQATVLLVDISGQLTGATNVDVNGVFYDVEFKDDTFTNIFGATPAFVATTESEAQLFSQALLDQVFIDSTEGNFDTDPSLTFGCSVFFINLCDVYTPYSANSISTILAVGAFNEAPGRTDRVSQKVQFNITDDLTDRPGQVYADWTLAASVPEPATLVLMGLGITGLGLTRRKRIRQAG